MGCAGARGRYVLGQLRSRTACVTQKPLTLFLQSSSFQVFIIFKKTSLFLGPGNSFLGRDSSVFFGTLKIDCSNTANNVSLKPAHIFWVFCPLFPYTQNFPDERMDGWTLDRLKLRILNKKRRRCAPAQKT